MVFLRKLSNARPGKALSAHHLANDVEIAPVQTVSKGELRVLYDSVGWSAYTRDMDVLVAAIRGSDFVVEARQAGELMGLARAISDDASVVYIQDILVREEAQGRGIGRALVRTILERYAHVRQKILLTDDRPEQLRFYAALGFRNTRDLIQTPLNAFVIIEGANLS